MPPKRKAVEKEEEEEVETPASRKKAKTPKSLKEKILHLLAHQEKLIGLSSLKKILKEEYATEDSKVNNVRILKTLKELEAESERDDFGKIGGSFHGGNNSPAYQDYLAKENAKEARKKLLEEHKDDYECPYCEAFNNNENRISDESEWLENGNLYSHSGEYQCLNCNGRFYLWLSDSGPNIVGHESAYKCELN